MTGEKRVRGLLPPALCAVVAVASALCSPAAFGQTRYDNEYPNVGYSDAPTDNPVSRLEARLESGEVTLAYRPGRGYLDSLLDALDIDPSSQVLVFSKTSLQQRLISGATPRAIYFNDDVYVGWVQGSGLIEFAVMDAHLGVVFYSMRNEQDEGARAHREDDRCLTCHDTYGMMGGGVPLFRVRSTLVNVDGEKLNEEPGIPTRDSTPLEERWGGWYVTGHDGGQPHRGNIQVHDAGAIADLDAVRRGNLDTLEGLGFFDTEPYLRATSDIVALMVLEHQVTVHNQIAYVDFKGPFVLERLGLADAEHAETWSDLPPMAQAALTDMLDELVERLLLVDAITFDAPIASTSGFTIWFEAQGPRDAEGRSLRRLDLKTRLFERPLSYLIYSEAFDGMAGYAKDYVYTKLAAVLDGRERSGPYARLSDDDRRELREILVATKPEFARYAHAGMGE